MTPRRVLPLLLAAAAAWGGMQALQAWHAQGAARAVASTARAGDIVMIASDTCVYCADARRWFAAEGVPFAECSIERDAACAEAYRALRSPGTPVMVVRGKPLLGFEPQRIARVLEAG